MDKFLSTDGGEMKLAEASQYQDPRKQHNPCNASPRSVLNVYKGLQSTELIGPLTYHLVNPNALTKISFSTHQLLDLHNSEQDYFLWDISLYVITITSEVLNVWSICLEIILDITYQYKYKLVIIEENICLVVSWLGRKIEISCGHEFRPQGKS